MQSLWMRRDRTRWIFAAGLAFALVLSACGGDDTSSINPDENQQFEDAGTPEPDVRVEPDAGNEPAFGDVAIPPIPTAIETEVVQPVINAGEAAVVECVLLDESGEAISVPDVEFDIAYGPDGTFQEAMDGRWIGVRAGEGTVRCAAPELALVDPTPGVITIEPGQPYSTQLALDETQIVAGGTVNGTCEVYDVYGNRIPAASTELVISPNEASTVVTLLSATFETAGVYDVSCRVSGVTEIDGVSLEVIPGPPANLNIDKLPSQNVYAVGQVVTITTVVTDEFGNVIENPSLVHTISPMALVFGDGRYRFDAEGVYTATVNVDGPTFQGIRLTRSTRIVVNSDGPAVQCDNPVDGSMLRATPGTSITLTGSVSDANGVQSVTVNGAGATLNSNGTFTASVMTRFGINFVEVIAQDSFGEENSRTCSFLVAPRFGGETSYINDAVMLKLRQPAIDDNQASDIDSFNDLLHRVVNSAGLRTELVNAITAGGTRLYNRCEARDPIFNVCVTRVTIDYRDLVISGPNDTSLTLVQDGLRATANIRNIGLRIRLSGQVLGIPYDTTGWIDLSELGMDLTLDLRSQLGRPAASVRQINSITVGSVSTRNFGGLDGLVVSIAISLFEGTIKNLIRDTIRDFITNNFNELLDDVFSSLDIDSLGSTFSVPKLDNSGDVTVAFGVRFNSVDVSTARALFGLGTRLTTTATQGKPSLGIPLQSTAAYLDPTTSRPVAVSIYAGILNQALHTLWRGGFFNANISGNSVGSFPAGVTATIDTDLPPVMQNLGNDKAQLSIGGMKVNLVYPGIFDQGIDVTLGAVAETSISIQGNDLTFGAVNITQLAFSTNSTSLDSSTRAVLENFLRALLQDVIDDALNGALPALPIPGFTLPASLGQYGLPTNQDLTIVNPVLRDTLSHYILEGTFGLR